MSCRCYNTWCNTYCDAIEACERCTSEWVVKRKEAANAAALLSILKPATPTVNTRLNHSQYESAGIHIRIDPDAPLLDEKHFIKPVAASIQHADNVSQRLRSYGSQTHAASSALTPVFCCCLRPWYCCWECRIYACWPAHGCCPACELCDVRIDRETVCVGRPCEYSAMSCCAVTMSPAMAIWGALISVNECCKLTCTCLASSTICCCMYRSVRRCCQCTPCGARCVQQHCPLPKHCCCQPWLWYCGTGVEWCCQRPIPETRPLPGVRQPHFTRVMEQNEIYPDPLSTVIGRRTDDFTSNAARLCWCLSGYGCCGWDMRVRQQQRESDFDRAMSHENAVLWMHSATRVLSSGGHEWTPLQQLCFYGVAPRPSHDDKKDRYSNPLQRAIARWAHLCSYPNLGCSIDWLHRLIEAGSEMDLVSVAKRTDRQRNDPCEPHPTGLDLIQIALAGRNFDIVYELVHYGMDPMWERDQTVVHLRDLHDIRPPVSAYWIAKSFGNDAIERAMSDRILVWRSCLPDELNAVTVLIHLIALYTRDALL